MWGGISIGWNKRKTPKEVLCLRLHKCGTAREGAFDGFKHGLVFPEVSLGFKHGLVFPEVSLRFKHGLVFPEVSLRFKHGLVFPEVSLGSSSNASALLGLPHHQQVISG